MGFRVRSATERDWAAYREIRLQMLAESPDAYGSAYADEARLPKERWRERAANPMLFLAYGPDGPLAGTATGVAGTGGTVDVVAMFVAAAHRGQGCAEALLDALSATARDRGARRLALHVTRGNAAATRCYLRYGFVRTGRSWPMERRPELTEVELALDLSPDAAG